MLFNPLNPNTPYELYCRILLNCLYSVIVNRWEELRISSNFLDNLITYFVWITYSNENLHTDKLSGSERVKMVDIVNLSILKSKICILLTVPLLKFSHGNQLYTIRRLICSFKATRFRPSIKFHPKWCVSLRAYEGTY